MRVSLARDFLTDLVARAAFVERPLLDLGQYKSRTGPRPGLSWIVNYLDVPTGSAFDVEPAQALDYFKAKGLQPTFSFADMEGAAHDGAFTIAKMMDVDMLGSVKADLESALANGVPYQDWADTVLPKLQAGGWWGRKAVTDPLTGETVVAQLGSPSRLETIFRTNMQTSYAAQKWVGIQDQKDVAGFLMYDAIDDFRTRPLHRAWDNTVLAVDDSWWKTHYPPNGYNCRCHVIQLSKDELDALGITPDAKAPDPGTYTWTNPRTGVDEEVPLGIDPGFGRNVGEKLVAQQQQLLAEKVAALDADLKAAANTSIEAMKAEVVNVQAALVQSAGKAALERAEAKAAQAAADAAAKKAAQDEIASITGGTATDPGNYLKQSVTLLKKAGTLPDDPVEALAAIKDQAAAQKQKQAIYAAQSAYKKAILAEKPVAASVLAKLDLMAPEAKQAFVKAVADALAEKKAAEAKAVAEKLAAEKKAAAIAKMKATKAANKEAKLAAAKQAELDAAAEALAAKESGNAQKAAEVLAPKNEAPAVTVGNAPKWEDLVQVGPQRGSNPGGLFQDKTTGQQWYVKFPSSEDAARNEVLAGKLYELAGVEVPELELINADGKTGIASKIVDGLSKGTPAQLAKAAGTMEGFATDAWLADWDAVGLDYDNLLLKAGRAVRVDVGGSLRYRAQGGLKGSAFGPWVGEIGSLRDASTNPKTAAVFGKITPAQLEASVRRVLAISDDQIRAAVELYGPTDDVERARLADTLIARKADLAEKFPGAVETPAPAEVPAASRVSEAEQAAVKAGGLNGYAFKTDAGALEDQSVLVNLYTDGAGQQRTRAWMKVRGDGMTALKAQIKAVAGGPEEKLPSIDISQWRIKTLEAIKGIASRASKGWEPKDVERLADALAEARSIRDQVAAMAKAGRTPADAAAHDALLTLLDKWRDEFVVAQDTVKVGATGANPFTDQFPYNQIPNRLTFNLPKAAAAEEPKGLTWQRKSSLPMETGKAKNGQIKLDHSTGTVPGVSNAYEAQLPGGGRVRFIDDAGNSYAMQGTLYFDLPGASADVSARIFKELEGLGINSQRATAADRDNLYLNAFAKLRFGREPAALAKFNSLADDVNAKLAFFKTQGVDVAASQGWKLRDGVYQAFGQGRAYQLRPDLTSDDIAKLSGSLVYRNYMGLGAGGGSSGTWNALQPIFEAGGQSASQVERVRMGTFTGDGSSVSSDFNSGGASYLFTRIKSATSAESNVGTYWKPDVLRRLDAITYSGDEFGDVTSGYERKRLGQDVTSLKSASRGSSNETIFKNGLSFYDDLDRIVLANAKEKNAALAWFASNGVAQWPDGRKVEDVIRYIGEG
jgi:SPP1 gp7 family putative phage head morphogenesis protein